MKSKLYTTLFIGITMLVVSCKTASKMYEKGNYDEAVELAAKKLQKDPNDAKLLDIIRNAYEYALNDHEDRIRNYESGTNELKWEWIYNEYADLQKMYDAIYRVPSVFNIVKPANYGSMMTMYADKAANVRFDRGLALMDRYDKESYKSAYREFTAALRYKPGDVNITMHRDEAFDYAVTNVVVLPLQQNGGFIYSSYTPGSNNLDDQLLRNLQYSNSNEFVKFYSAWDARSRGIRIDQQVDMHLSDMNIRPTQDYRSTRRVSKEVVVKETVYTKDSVVKEYAKVYADITTTRRTKVSEAVLQVNVRNADGRWIWSEDFRATHNWSAEFASYTGDSRALSDADRALIDRRPQQGPGENEVTDYLLNQISNDAQYRIRNFFNSY